MAVLLCVYEVRQKRILWKTVKWWIVELSRLYMLILENPVITGVNWYLIWASLGPSAIGMSFLPQVNGQDSIMK
jgi:hypothetical protein